ncbi:MAG: hypothetical protein R3177_11640, partial [Arsukibacterium sp.]|nr:hypothetical protein [Arsukibacterium sp.]
MSVRQFGPALCLLAALLLSGCVGKNPGNGTVVSAAKETVMTDNYDARYQPEPYVKLSHPQWSKDAVIYQINT